MVRPPHPLPGLPRRHPGSRWGHALALVVGLLGPAPGRADDGPVALQDAVAALEAAADDRDLMSPAEAQRRFEDVLFAFMLEEYEAAAEATWAVRPFLATGPLRYEADHQLAVSLREIGATTLEQRVNAEILADPAHPFAHEAAALQIELYAEHRSAAEFAALYGDLRERGLVEAATGELAYAIGRAHWRLGHLDDAADAFGRVAQTEAPSDRARYHLGVIAVKQGDLALAVDRFTALRQAPVTDLAIAELCTLALARIAYEQDRLDEAADLYRMFDPGSPVRATALEELAWTELRRDDLPAAALALQERLRLFPDAPSPEVQATLARLHLQFGEAQPAEEAFTAAITTFEELLRAIPRLHADPDLPGLLADPGSELPADEAWAVDRLRGDDRIVRAAHVVEVGRHAGDGLAETIELVRELEDRLQSDPSTVRDRRVLADATRQLLDVAEARLAWAEERVGSGREARAVRAAVAEARDVLAETRATLERLDLLHTADAFDTARAADAAAIAAAREAADRQGVEIPDGPDGLRRRIEAVVVDVRAQVASRRGPVQTRLAAERRDLQAIAAVASDIGGRSDAVWTRARALGAEALMARVDASLEGVRSGLADASWARLSELRQEQATLDEARTRALAELDAVFDLAAERGR